MSKTAISFVALLTLVVIVSFQATAQDNSGKTKDSAEVSTVLQLRQNRVAVLEKLLSMQTRAFDQGRNKIETVLDAEAELLAARLEMATAKAKRIEIREAALAVAQKREDVVRARFEQGHFGVETMLRSEADTLRAAIDLEVEREGQR